MDPAVKTIANKFYRLIPSRFPPVDVYERLGTRAQRERAQQLEAMTNPRLASLARSEAVHDSKLAGEPRYQNWNHAPFAYLDPEGSWFLGPAFGALELAQSQESALLLAVARRERFLLRTHEIPIELDMRLLVTEVSGVVAQPLVSPAAPEAERWAIGERLRSEGFSGAVHRRNDVPGEFLAVFSNKIHGRSVQAAHYRFAWNGDRIRSIYDFGGRIIDPTELRERLQSLEDA
jgi:hypothetical protein